MWLLLLIQLATTPQPHVVHVEVVQIFDTEKKCIKRVKAIPQKELPKNVNMGCVPLNGKRS
jgi:hypothetical protein